MTEVIKRIEELVQKQFENEGTGHDWYHIDRVRKIALKINSKEGGNRDIVELAALLHDISDHKFNGGDFQKGGEVSRQILMDCHVDEKTIQAVVDIVNNVSFKGSGVENNIKSIEGKIVQDADRIDAVGAIGIARTFAYGGAVGQPIYDPKIAPKTSQTKEEYVSGRTHTINHFYEKLLLLADRMHTKNGRIIALERTAYMQDFLDQFYSEWNVD